MNKIVTIEQAIQVAHKLNKQNKSIVLAGGCFDILHIGHITFLEKAKKEGDVLLLLLEHDTNVKKIKGATRPINTQGDRAIILASLESVDHIVLLPQIDENKTYENLVKQIKPAIIATTAGDPNRHHKEQHALQIQAKVLDVTGPVIDQSTTRIINLLKNESE